MLLTNEIENLSFEQEDLIIPRDKSYYLNLNYHLSHFDYIDDSPSTPINNKCSCFCFSI